MTIKEEEQRWTEPVKDESFVDFPDEKLFWV